MTFVQWTHPNQGRIHEVLCETHTHAVLAALTVLGIGCIGEPARKTQRACGRCAAEALGVEARFYLGLAG